MCPPARSRPRPLGPGALSKLVEKLVVELGDLELVMDCPTRREELAGLPVQAIKLLLQVGGACRACVHAWFFGKVA